MNTQEVPAALTVHSCNPNHSQALKQSNKENFLIKPLATVNKNELSIALS